MKEEIEIIISGILSGISGILFGILGILIIISPIFFLIMVSILFFGEHRQISTLRFILYVILGGIAGLLWGGLPLTEAYASPFIVEIIIFGMAGVGIFLSFMLKLPKIGLTKSIFVIFIIIFIISPIIASDILPRSPYTLREMATKKNLNILRSIIIAYYKKNKHYPKMSILPRAPVQLSLKLQGKCCIDSTKVLVVSTKPYGKIQPHQITDEGGWIYSSDSGDIRINCSHLDSKGIPYSSW